MYRKMNQIVEKIQKGSKKWLLAAPNTGFFD